MDICLIGDKYLFDRRINSYISQSTNHVYTKHPSASGVNSSTVVAVISNCKQHITFTALKHVISNYFLAKINKFNVVVAAELKLMHNLKQF